ncbi:hypothetical protein CDAR_247781 [Caerostris darwini]|uniref:Uncharacterized protein n=1 Tax=Caerostris darwini TaxID=1538125 RepID=A0AAV4RQG1_9ARAC|nr:hypothetical protein CDAR_247781 [Caerostris darwini]
MRMPEMLPWQHSQMRGLRKETKKIPGKTPAYWEDPSERQNFQRKKLQIETSYGVVLSFLRTGIITPSRHEDGTQPVVQIIMKNFH